MSLVALNNSFSVGLQCNALFCYTKYAYSSKVALRCVLVVPKGIPIRLGAGG
jgi:hypothetical protein